MLNRRVHLVHATGNANVRAALYGLQKANMLGNFYTTIAAFQDNIFGQLSSIKGLAALKRRSYDSVLSNKTSLFPEKEICRLILEKVGMKVMTQHESGIFSIDKVIRSLDKKVSFDIINKTSEIPNAIYAYEDGAIHSFRAVKEKNIKCLYDLPIGYWRTAHALMEEEYERWPEWAKTIPTFIDSPTKLDRKDQELALADHIFVASSFTKKTLHNFTHCTKLYTTFTTLFTILQQFTKLYTSVQYCLNKNRNITQLYQVLQSFITL
jgi:hypothetical protein